MCACVFVVRVVRMYSMYGYLVCAVVCNIRRCVNAIGVLCVKWNIMPVSVCMYVCVSFVHVCLSVVYVGIYNCGRSGVH